MFTQTGAAEGSHLPLWLASALLAAYVMVGLDSAGELSEETHQTRHTTPRTSIKALQVPVGGLVLVEG